MYHPPFVLVLKNKKTEKLKVLQFELMLQRMLCGFTPSTLRACHLLTNKRKLHNVFVFVEPLFYFSFLRKKKNHSRPVFYLVFYIKCFQTFTIITKIFSNSLASHILTRFIPPHIYVAPLRLPTVRPDTDALILLLPPSLCLRIHLTTQAVWLPAQFSCLPP